MEEYFFLGDQYLTADGLIDAAEKVNAQYVHAEGYGLVEMGDMGRKTRLFNHVTHLRTFLRQQSGNSGSVYKIEEGKLDKLEGPLI